MPPSSLSKARTYLSISLGKSTSWIANVKATRSSRPPPKACSRQVSTDETRKQVRTTMKRMAMMNKKALVIIDSSSSIAPRLICSTQVVKVALQDAIHHEEPRIRFSIVLKKSWTWSSTSLDYLFLHCYHCQDPHSSARTAVNCSQEEPQRNAGATNIIYKVL